MRGGTSKALMLLASDLPAEREQWAPIFMAAMGTPDPYGRQLDGMGGGVSSLSKEYIISPSKQDRKSTRLNSSHVAISYAVFCLKKKRLKEAACKCTLTV